MLVHRVREAASKPEGAEPGDVDATIERLLELPAELAAEQERRVALVLDEFQEIGGIGPGEARKG